MLQEDFLVIFQYKLGLLKLSMENKPILDEKHVRRGPTEMETPEYSFMPAVEKKPNSKVLVLNFLITIQRVLMKDFCVFSFLKKSIVYDYEKIIIC